MFDLPLLLLALIVVTLLIGAAFVLTFWPLPGGPKRRKFRRSNRALGSGTSVDPLRRHGR